MEAYESDNDSDKELQVAFEKGLLKDLVIETNKIVRTKINNKQGLEESVQSFKKSLPWVETLDICTEPLPLPDCVEIDEDKIAEDNIKLENLFYRQAQAAVLIGLRQLKSLNVPTKRPEDYYAEMIKTDDHMRKVKEKLLSLEAIKEKADKARKEREARKFKKLAVKEDKKSKKKENLLYKESLKKMKKKFQLGNNSKDDGKQNKKKDGDKKSGFKPKPNGGKTPSESSKRKFKNEKYGFGGQKKRSKGNTKESFNNF